VAAGSIRGNSPGAREKQQDDCETHRTTNRADRSPRRWPPV
jgi:hypothetical protein